jgi:ribosomal protein S12 methylthiotransferase accessory factor
MKMNHLMDLLPLREPPRRELRDVVRSGLRCVSYKTGIIKALLEQSLQEDDPLIFSFGTIMADTRRYSPHRCSERTGGAGLTKDQALAATIGEAIERYCSNFYHQEDLLVSSYEKLRHRAVAPRDFVLFSEQQHCEKGFPFDAFTEASRVAWTWSYSLVHGEPTLVPACFTYLPYAFQNGEAILGPSISTGIACGSSLEEAVLLGIYECLERDAFTIMWLNRLSMPVVDITDGESLAARLLREKFSLSHIKYCVCDITSDIGVPTFFTLAIGHSTLGPLVCVGSAARLEAQVAVQKTLVETAQARPYLRYVLRKKGEWRCGDAFSNVCNFDDHARLYSSMPELIPKVQFVDQPATRCLDALSNRSTGTITGDINVCVSALAAKGFDVLVVDLTTREVAELGFCVTRVLIPGLQPLHGDHRFRFLGGKRLYQVPRILGYTEQDTAEQELYPWPHPFP